MIREANWEVLWKDHAKSAEINPAQRLRQKEILKCLNLKPGDTVRCLDLGSGQGDLCALIQKEFPHSQIRGVELTEEGIRVSKSKIARGEFHRADLCSVEPPPKNWESWATHATCSEVLEHVEDPSAFLRNASSYMSPGCKLVVTVPSGPMSAFDRHLGHLRHFTVDTLKASVERAGLEVDSIARGGFPFFNLYRLVVIARGRRLISDVHDTQLSPAAVWMMRLFEWLFQFNLANCPGGWQLVAVIRKKAPNV